MFAATATATGLVDWPLLAHVVLDAAVAGIGLVVVFAVGLVGVSMARKTSANSLHRGTGAALSAAVALTILWALWWGFELIVKKS